MVFLGFRLSRKGPTERYPYGLERAEDLAGIGIAVVTGRHRGCGVPELICLDDWGFPIIADGRVPARLQPAAGEAVRICPKLALRLEPGPESDRGGTGQATALWRHPAPAHQRGHPGDMAVPPHRYGRAG